RLADVRVQVAEAGQRVRRVHHARTQRELLHPVALALMNDERRGPFVNLEHESWPRHRWALSSSLWRERHLERAELPRRHRVIDRIAPPVQRTGGADESLQDRPVLRR